MFERYTEAARQSIFFAREEASQAGSAFIETEHFLLGLLRADGVDRERLRRELAQDQPLPERIARIREEMMERASSGTGRVGGGGGGWRTGPKGEVRDGRYSSSWIEGGANVIETQITIIERLRLSDDGRTLSFSQEIAGPKQTQRYTIDFDVS
ncbi:MAG: Clp protease N-terminal domain-containing protein [Bryobacteraceae bacterium]